MSPGVERPRPATWLQYFYFHAINHICFPLSLILGSYAFLAAVPTTPPRLRSPTLAAMAAMSTCQGSEEAAGRLRRGGRGPRGGHRRAAAATCPPASGPRPPPYSPRPPCSRRPPPRRRRPPSPPSSPPATPATPPPRCSPRPQARPPPARPTPARPTPAPPPARPTPARPPPALWHVLLRHAPIFGGLLFLQVSPFQVFDHPGAYICGIADQLVKDLRWAQDCWLGTCDHGIFRGHR